MLKEHENKNDMKTKKYKKHKTIVILRTLVTYFTLYFAHSPRLPYPIDYSYYNRNLQLLFISHNIRE